MELKIAVLPGDGIGPEISRVGVKILDSIAKRFHHKFNYDYGLIGAAAIDETGDPFPDSTMKLCLDSDAILFSCVGDLRFDNNPASKVRPEQGLLKMRKSLELYANIRPIETFGSLLSKSPLKEEIIREADFVCVRELTGGMYFGEKFEGEDKAFDTNLYTRGEIERILHTAYGLALKRKRHLTVVDKANVLASSRLWRKVAQEISKEYPDVKTDYMFVDNASMRIIQDPRFFDVVVTENTFGDILTDEASVITGSMGLLPSASTGNKTPLFEPVHGSWPEAAGKNIANPIAQILSSAMLVEHFGLISEGKAIRDAVEASLNADICTADIQKKDLKPYTTSEVGDWIAHHIEAGN